LLFSIEIITQNKSMYSNLNFDLKFFSIEIFSVCLDYIEKDIGCTDL